MKKFLLYMFLLSMSTQLIHAVAPPTKEQIHQYKEDGTYEVRKKKALAFKNHIMSPRLIKKLPITGPSTRVLPSGVGGQMPSLGNVKMLVLMIDFSDFPHKNSKEDMVESIKGESAVSFKSFFSESSYNKLDLEPTVLGWYRSKKSRANIVQNTAGREELIKEALNYYEAQGHDFSQYDNNNDGYVDYLAVFWTGPDNGWANFWWAYSTGFSSTIELDGVKFSNYTWQWESTNMSTLEHETGHALGLPDLYDYSADAGPNGGLGGYGLMAGSWGDFNPYFKWLLDWSTPRIMSAAEERITLEPSALRDTDSSVVIWKNASKSNPHSEFFLVANKWRVGLDSSIHTDGLIIYHVDGSLNASNRWKYNNSYTEHKFMRIMEADGLEEIEQGHWVDAGDYYTEGDTFSSQTMPSSNAYDGTDTKISISNIEINNVSKNISFDAKIGGTMAEMKSPLSGATLDKKTKFTFERNQVSSVYMHVIDKNINKYLYAGYVQGDTLELDVPRNGHDIEVILYSYISGKWIAKRYNYKAGELYIQLFNQATGRYVFSAGSVVTKREYGWLRSKSIVGTDIDYYDRTTWKLIPYGSSYLLQNKVTKRYLFSTGKKVSSPEGGWLKSPKIVGTDTNYYSNAEWNIVKLGDNKFYLKNVATNRFLLQTGSKVKSHEGGWLKSPSLVGADLDYYDRAKWTISGSGLDILK